jgi:hypothetical protein
MPSTNLPPESRSSDAAAPAVMAGSRVAKFVTQLASRTRVLSVAACARATHTSMALPGVSAMPTRSHPCSSPSRTMRATSAGS